MPKEVYDEDGVSLGEMPTAEELKILQDKSNNVDSLEADLKTAREDLAKVKEDDDVPSDIKALRNTHKSHKALLKKMEEKGYKLDEEGNLTTDKQMSDEDINKKIEENSNRLHISRVRGKALSKYTDEQKAVLDKYIDRYDKSGELAVDNVDEVIAEAIRASGLADEDGTNSTNTAVGSPPQMNTGEKLNRDLGEKLGLTQEDMDKAEGKADNS